MHAEKITVPAFVALKRAGRRIVMLTAYDYLSAALLDDCGVDALLVGDSLAMVVQGRSSTLPVTLEQILYHTEMVARAAKRALVIADLPFGTFQLGTQTALQAACRLLKESGTTAVKAETTLGQIPTIAALVEAGIPTMAHIGLRPQNIQIEGTYRVQRDTETLVAEAQAAERAGAFSILLECVSSAAAKAVTEAVAIPTIGIGAGVHCDGQVLVTPDLLGLTPGKLPKFSKPYLDLRARIRSAVDDYAREVRDGTFPGPEHSYK